MLYLDLGYHTLSYNSLDVDLKGWIGQSYFAGMLSGRFSLRSARPSYLEFMGVVGRQKFYDSELLFYQTSTPTFITETQNFLRMKYVWAMSRKTIGFADLTWGYESDSYFPTNIGDYANMRKDKTQYLITALKAGFKGGLLNDPLYPSSGMEWRADIQGSYERSRFTPYGDKSLRTKYDGHFRASAELYWKQFFSVAKHFTVGGSANVLGTLQQLPQNYTATLVHAPAFAPTPSTQNYFNEAFRSDNYVAAGVMPIWSPVNKLQIRGDFYVFSPIRDLKRGTNDAAVYKGWFNRAEFIGEMAVVYNFPFASLSLYGNYLSYPARNWNFGINFGLLFHAPKILR